MVGCRECTFRMHSYFEITALGSTIWLRDSFIKQEARINNLVLAQFAIIVRSFSEQKENQHRTDYIEFYREMITDNNSFKTAGETFLFIAIELHAPKNIINTNK